MAESPYQEWTRKLTESLAFHLNLSGWQFFYEWIEPDASTDPDEYANISVNSDYLWATIRFKPPAKRDFEAGKYEMVVQAVLHELVHIFLDPFQNWMFDYLSKTTTPLFMSTVEQQTQRLTMVILKTLPSSVIPPPPHGKHNRTPKNGKSRPVVS